MGKTALITGVSGQDGAYLAKLLLGKGVQRMSLNRPTFGGGTIAGVANEDGKSG